VHGSMGGGVLGNMGAGEEGCLGAWALRVLLPISDARAPRGMSKCCETSQFIY
jgi:hypothetical protein